MKKILPDIHQINLGGVNAFLIDHGDLTLIDTGYPNSCKKFHPTFQKFANLHLK